MRSGISADEIFLRDLLAGVQDRRDLIEIARFLERGESGSMPNHGLLRFLFLLTNDSQAFHGGRDFPIQPFEKIAGAFDLGAVVLIVLFLNRRLDRGQIDLARRDRRIQETVHKGFVLHSVVSFRCFPTDF